MGTFANIPSTGSLKAHFSATNRGKASFVITILVIKFTTLLFRIQKVFPMFPLLLLLLFYSFFFNWIAKKGKQHVIGGAIEGENRGTNGVNYVDMATIKAGTHH